MNGSNPLVSVLIPAYNHAHYITETISSIISQTYDNIELIIINDGSKDNTWDIIQSLKTECEKRFANVDFDTQENAGTSTTLNRLCKKAKGKYIYLIASDDVAKPNAINNLVSILENDEQIVLAVGDNEFIDNNSNVTYMDNTKRTFGQILQANKQIDFLSSDFGTYNSLINGNYIPNGYLFKKSTVDNYVNFTKDAPLEDWYLHLQLSKHGKYKYINEILFSYRWHDTNTAKNKRRMFNLTKQTFFYEKEIVKKEQYLQFKKILDNYYKLSNKFIFSKTFVKLLLYRILGN